MGKQEQEIYFLLEKLGLKIFSIDDLAAHGFDKRVVHDSLSSLAKKGILTRVRRGVYVKASSKMVYDRLQQFESPLIIASKIAEKGYYIGYISAMQFYGVMEQVPFVVYVATLRRRRNFRYGEYEVKFVYLGKKKFFGYEKREMAGDYLYVSDKEKTVIDCLDHPEYCGGIEDAAHLIGELISKEKMDWDKLVAYALKMKEQALIHRLGYVLESLSERYSIPQRVLKRLEREVKPYAYYLTKDAKGKFIKKWQLVVREGIALGV